jgi:hypothetical protein
MKTARQQASARLFKKLSALRATLSNEERDILDNLIVVEEVSAHKLTTKAMSKVANKTQSKAAEVAAHKMSQRATSKTVAKNTSKAAAKTTFRIAFDPNSEEYKIQD